MKKKSQRKSKKFHLFLIPTGHWGQFSFLSQLIGLTIYFVVGRTLSVCSEQKWAKLKALQVPLPCMSNISYSVDSRVIILLGIQGPEERLHSLMCKPWDLPLSLVAVGHSPVVIPRFRQITFSIGAVTSNKV